MEFFETFAECSIAFAGFAAIHAMLHGSSGPRGALRAWSTVAPGLVAFVLAILPPLLSQGPWSTDAIWKFASAVGVFAIGIQATTFILDDVRMARLGYPPQAPVFIRVAQASSISAALVMSANVVGWPSASGPFTYAIGLGLALLPGLVALTHSFRITIDLALGRPIPGLTETNGEPVESGSKEDDSS